jgi:ABC-type sugar transport system ATPase subunit
MMLDSSSPSTPSTIPPNSNATDLILETRDLCKSFGAVHAVRHVNLRVRRGEVLALLGDNGAGKSTLIKLLSGAIVPSSGEILVRGERVRLGGPADALKLGIAPVYQDLALVESRNVVQNMFLGGELTHGLFGWFLDHARMMQEAQRVLGEMRSRIPSAKEVVRKLSGGQRQAVAIARTLIRGGEVIIMDEPTAALGVEQTAEVLSLIHTLRAQGRTVILITHNIGHVFEVADRVAVMFRGELIGSRAIGDTTQEEVVAMIVGSKRDAPETS